MGPGRQREVHGLIAVFAAVNLVQTPGTASWPSVIVPDPATGVNIPIDFCALDAEPAGVVIIIVSESGKPSLDLVGSALDGECPSGYTVRYIGLRRTIVAGLYCNILAAGAAGSSTTCISVPIGLASSASIQSFSEGGGGSTILVITMASTNAPSSL